MTFTDINQVLRSKVMHSQSICLSCPVLFCKIRSDSTLTHVHTYTHTHTHTHTEHLDFHDKDDEPLYRPGNDDDVAPLDLGETKS